MYFKEDLSRPITTGFPVLSIAGSARATALSGSQPVGPVRTTVPLRSMRRPSHERPASPLSMRVHAETSKCRASWVARSSRLVARSYSIRPGMRGEIQRDDDRRQEQPITDDASNNASPSFVHSSSPFHPTTASWVKSRQDTPSRTGIIVEDRCASLPESAVGEEILLV